MITTEKAFEIIRQHTTVLGKEVVELPAALNRVLAEDIFSDVDIPAFNKAAMDGYACRKSDLSMPLTVIEEIPAGSWSERPIIKGQCARIMTGAPVPEGADTVIMKEHVTTDEQEKICFTRDKSNTNICLKGEDVKTGEQVLASGMLVQPEHIAVLAGAGKSNVQVYRCPHVAVLPTGNELVEPDTKPEAGQLRNSNGQQLMAQLTAMGIPATYGGVVKDQKEALKTTITRMLDNHDVLLFSGGVSVGDYDYVPEVLNELGFDIHITQMAVKPGKHTLFATRKGKYVLGVPGNPVSSFVQLQTVASYLLHRLMGHEWKPLRIQSIMKQDYSRKKDGRFEFLPVIIHADGKVGLLSYSGSAHIHALVHANALMEIPTGIKTINKGDNVYVRPL